ncbi:hypothetical protein [Mycolicibacterium sphagni]|uniref:PE-PPE domain-containing protein n=1 Tax=Mycolicibacterium sphagni TaxID=1786 RepID=A0ABX2JK69_9MYCO|nr:hypothetical protein [Mycolicibacterium sphagni]NTY58044.1 hypothetical protein [Mycolicibacterium sphagni]
MELAVGRPMLTVAALTTAGALALSPITVTPPDMHALDLSPATISTQAVQLTDAWSDLLTDTVGSVVQLGGLFLGQDSNFPLPNPTIPLAPIATQLVLNQLIYVAQLVTGQGAKIPTEIIDHATQVFQVAYELGKVLPEVILTQLQVPIFAAQEALKSITTSSNLLIGLLEAPAVFLNLALNSQYGLLGQTGPIAVPIIVRNLLAKAVYTPLPTIVLPFKKASGAAAVTPNAAAAAAASGTASSARSKPKAPASSNRKATSAKAKSSAGSGTGHSKRG